MSTSGPGSAKVVVSLYSWGLRVGRNDGCGLIYPQVGQSGKQLLDWMIYINTGVWGRAGASERQRCWPDEDGYLPIQNDEKMRPNRSSLENEPVISPKAF